MRVGDEVLWDIDEHATLFIEPNPEQAGAGRITFAVEGLDALLERIVDECIEHEPFETYSSGVRHVNIPDPDGTGSRSQSRPTYRARELEAREEAEDATLSALREHLREAPPGAPYTLPMARAV